MFVKLLEKNWYLIATTYNQKINKSCIKVRFQRLNNVENSLVLNVSESFKNTVKNVTFPPVFEERRLDENVDGISDEVYLIKNHPKDENDLIWALENGCDLIALSFVRNAKDIEDVHKIMDKSGRRIPVVAKIEKPQAVSNLEQILQSFDAIMIARGDLGVELPLEEVPLVQKNAIQLDWSFGRRKNVLRRGRARCSTRNFYHPSRHPFWRYFYGFSARTRMGFFVDHKRSGSESGKIFRLRAEQV